MFENIIKWYKMKKKCQVYIIKLYKMKKKKNIYIYIYMNILAKNKS